MLFSQVDLQKQYILIVCQFFNVVLSNFLSQENGKQTVQDISYRNYMRIFVWKWCAYLHTDEIALSVDTDC